MLYLQECRGKPEYRRSIRPKDRLKFNGKTEHWRAIKSRDPAGIAIEYARIHGEFEAILAMPDADGHIQGREEFQKLAGKLGIAPIPDDIEEANILDVVELAARNFEAASNLPVKKRLAVLATSLHTQMTLEDYYEKYEVITRDKDLKRSPRERAKFHDPIKRALKECAEIIGKADVRKLTKADVHRFRDKLISDIERGKITPSTANKKIMHARKVVEAVNRVYYPNLSNPFAVARIEDNEIGQRPPFTEAEICKIKQELMGSDLNDELKAIIVVGMYSGAGCKEIALLTTKDIVLDCEVPHIKIGVNEFRVKVKGGGERHRDVPLYGDALEYIKNFSGGFPRYRRDGGGEAVSAAANKFLKRLTGKTYYSFRHRLADLLRDSGCEDQLRNAIFGHRQGEITNHYGKGWGLSPKYQALKNAFEYKEGQDDK